MTELLAGSGSLALTTLAGPDAAGFLQGYLTSDTDVLEADLAVPTAFTSLKGRVLANGWVFGSPDRVRLVVHESTVALVHEHLRKYLAFSRSGFEPDVEPVHLAPAANESDTSTRLATLAPLGRALCRGAGADEWLEPLIDARFALVTEATADRFLPQMLGLTELGAVSFTKGCYLGQEIVARAEHRGEVKRRLRAFRWSGARPRAGDDVLEGDRRIGTIVMAGPATVLAVTNVEHVTLHGPDFELNAI